MPVLEIEGKQVVEAGSVPLTANQKNVKISMGGALFEIHLGAAPDAKGEIIGGATAVIKLPAMSGNQVASAAGEMTNNNQKYAYHIEVRAGGGDHSSHLLSYALTRS